MSYTREDSAGDFMGRLRGWLERAEREQLTDEEFGRLYRSEIKEEVDSYFTYFGENGYSIED
jgi:hypothetical protein